MANGIDFGTAVGLIKGLGSPDPAVIESAVNGWLDDHPEATTTVQDGSITKAKLDSNLQGTVDDVADLKSHLNEIDKFVTGTVFVGTFTTTYQYIEADVPNGSVLMVQSKDGSAVNYGLLLYNSSKTHLASITLSYNDGNKSYYNVTVDGVAYVRSPGDFTTTSDLYIVSGYNAKKKIDDLTDDVGTLENLTTTEKSNLVGAINEINENAAKQTDVAELQTAMGLLDEKIASVEQAIVDSFDYSFTDNVTAGTDYKGYAGGEKIDVSIPQNTNFVIKVTTDCFDAYTLYVKTSGNYFAFGDYDTNEDLTISTGNYNLTSITLWAKAVNVSQSGTFTFVVSVPNQTGLEARMNVAESDIDVLSAADVSMRTQIDSIESRLSGMAVYTYTDSVVAGTDYKGYITGHALGVAIPSYMPYTINVETTVFSTYSLFIKMDGADFINAGTYNVNSNISLVNNSEYEIIAITLLVYSSNITASGDFKINAVFKPPLSYDITTLNPESEMLPKIQNGRVSIEYAGRTGSNRVKCLTLCHFSDIHATAINLSRVVDFCAAYNSYIDDIYCTGDLVRDNANEDFAFWAESGAENVLSVIGNHDTAVLTGGVYDWRGFGALNAYNKYFAPFISNWGVTQPSDAATDGKCYYYKDYATYGIRVIVLDCMYYDSTEDTWFAETLASARASGYKVIVCAHGLGTAGQGIECTFNSLEGTAGQVIADTSTFIYNASVHVRVDEFITAGGTFICFLGGHFHVDYFGMVSGTVNPQPYVLVGTASWNAPIRDYAVEKFDRTMDDFNIISFDTRLSLIKIVKVGIRDDCWMRKKDTLCYDYANHTLIYG